MKLAFCEIPKGQKNPQSKGWNEKSAAIYDIGKLRGGNVGLLPAYCEPPLVHLDVDNVELAEPMLAQIGFDINCTRGRFRSGRDNSLSYIFESGSDILPSTQFQVGDNLAYELRMASKDGKSVCSLLPPSVHPSGSVYSWCSKPFVFDPLPESLRLQWRHRLELMKSVPPILDSICNGIVTDVEDALRYIDADCDYNTWIEILFSIQSTNLPNAREIALQWSKTSSQKFNQTAFNNAWNSYKPGHYSKGTLFHYAKLSGRRLKGEEKVHLIDSGTNGNMITKPELPASSRSTFAILKEMSIRGKSEEMGQTMTDNVFVLKDIALMGQWTTINARYNAGKTLLTMWMLRESIKSGEIDPRDVVYVNCDDDERGEAAKAKICEMFGFEMVVDGRSGFQAEDLLDRYIPALIKNDEARGKVFILDTLKVFVDVMNKSSCRNFGILAKRFTGMGGTIIALAHVNKYNDRETGKPIFEGTSDVPNDCHCTYTIDVVNEEYGVHTVEWARGKKRGDNAASVSFQFTSRTGMSYHEILDSVVRLDDRAITEIRETISAHEKLKNNGEIINVAREVIAESDGRWFKGQVVKEIQARCQQHGLRGPIGVNAIRKVLNDHEGKNYEAGHRWVCKQFENGWSLVLVNKGGLKKQ